MVLSTGFSSSWAKVMCSHPGCIAQPLGFNGHHEMRKHFERDHGAANPVYVCALLAEDPDFLSKCKHCQSQKPYKKDCNAGAHLRRCHFSPKKAEACGYLPSMETLRDYMFTYEVDANGNRVTDPQKVEISSSVIIPNLPISIDAT